MSDRPWVPWVVGPGTVVLIIALQRLGHRTETSAAVEPALPDPRVPVSTRLLHRLRRRRAPLGHGHGVMPPRAQIALLHGGHVLVDGRRVPWLSRRARTHLTLLALRRGQYVDLEDLAAAVRDTGEHRRKATQAALDRLVVVTAAVAGDGALPLQRRGDAWMLPDTPGLVDVDDVDVLLRRGLDDLQDGRVARAAATLGTVVRLLPRAPLRDLDGAEVDRFRVTLLRRRQDAEQGRAEAERRLAERARAAQAARAEVDAYPHDETAWEAYALALHRAGRTADALAALAEAGERLARDLGTRPGPRLRLLQGRIEADDPALRADGSQNP